MFHCRPLKPLPEHLSRPAALLIVGDISRFVCPFLSAAACSGSVAGRGCRRTEGWSVKKPIWMKTWRFVAFTQPASAFDPLNVSVGICAVKSCSVRSEAGQVFVISSHQQLVSLISPALLPLWLNVHKISENSCLGRKAVVKEHQFVWLEVRGRSCKQVGMGLELMLAFN